MRTFAYFSAPKNTPRRNKLAPLVLLASAVMGLTACGINSSSDVQRLVETTPDEVEQPQQGGVLEYGHLQEPNCIYGGWIQENFTARQVLDSLVSQTEDGEIVPWIATDWEVSDNGLVWTLTLRDDVQFTDGTPLNAEAVAYNFVTGSAVATAPLPLISRASMIMQKLSMTR